MVFVYYRYGAGSENRTRATRSEAWDSTTKLYPHQYKYYTTKTTNMQTKIGKKSKKSYCKKREKMIKSKHKSQKKE